MGPDNEQVLDVPVEELVNPQLVKHGREFGKIQRHVEARALPDHHGTPSHRREEDTARHLRQTARSREQAGIAAARADIEDAIG